MKNNPLIKQSLLKMKEGLELSLKACDEQLAEIAAIEKQSEPQPLSFLQLAEKWDMPVYNVLSHLRETYSGTLAVLTEVYAHRIDSELGISETQARKFVAEIYLTLLAKELNGDWVADYNDNKQEKFIPCYNSHAGHCCIKREVLEFGNVEFRSEEIFNKALRYSPEAEQMWNWYFGKEEGK